MRHIYIYKYIFLYYIEIEIDQNGNTLYQYLPLSRCVWSFMNSKSVWEGVKSFATSLTKALQWSRIGGLLLANSFGIYHPNLYCNLHHIYLYIIDGTHSIVISVHGIQYTKPFYLPATWTKWTDIFYFPSSSLYLVVWWQPCFKIYHCTWSRKNVNFVQIEATKLKCKKIESDTAYQIIFLLV